MCQFIWNISVLWHVSCWFGLRCDGYADSGKRPCSPWKRPCSPCKRPCSPLNGCVYPGVFNQVYVLDSRDMLVVKLNRTAAHIQQHKHSIARWVTWYSHSTRQGGFTFILQCVFYISYIFFNILYELWFAVAKRVTINLIHEPLGEGSIKLPPLRFVEYLQNLMSYERETWHNFQ